MDFTMLKVSGSSPLAFAVVSPGFLSADLLPPLCLHDEIITNEHTANMAGKITLFNFIGLMGYLSVCPVLHRL